MTVLGFLFGFIETTSDLQSKYIIRWLIIGYLPFQKFGSGTLKKVYHEW